LLRQGIFVAQSHVGNTPYIRFLDHSTLSDKLPLDGVPGANPLANACPPFTTPSFFSFLIGLFFLFPCFFLEVSAIPERDPRCDDSAIAIWFLGSCCPPGALFSCAVEIFPGVFPFFTLRAFLSGPLSELRFLPSFLTTVPPYRALCRPSPPLAFFARWSKGLRFSFPLLPGFNLLQVITSRSGTPLFGPPILSTPHLRLSYGVFPRINLFSLSPEMSASEARFSEDFFYQETKGHCSKAGGHAHELRNNLPPLRCLMFP